MALAAPTVDAVVIGSGPNGLVAANLLADAGWDVVVLEAQPTPGGAVRTAELTVPGFHHDAFSAFYPLAAASPIIAGLALEDHGLVWRRAPLALAHPTPDGRCAVISSDRRATAASLDAYSQGDGAGWGALMALWDRYGRQLIEVLLRPFPPVRAGVGLGARSRVQGTLELLRLALVPARRLGQEHFDGEGGRLLLAGNALHTDLAPETAGSGLFGWLLCALAEDVGFPVPEGGAGRLAEALGRRLRAAGGEVICDQPVARIVVRGGRAVGVETRSGGGFTARRAVLADVAAPHLYSRLLAGVDLPARTTAALRRFEWDAGTVKVDWALRAPVPWTAADARRAGTVHVADSVDDLTRWSADLATGTVPARPFMLVGQQSMTDPTRMPPGCETVWAYTHVPRTVRADAAGRITGRWDATDVAAMVERMERRMEELAPGFGGLVLGRHVFAPGDLAAADANLDGGSINGGTSQLHQQLVFRPVPGSGRPTTPVAGLYLASASAHPGGGVHGSCGSNAAHAALAGDRWRLHR